MSQNGWHFEVRSHGAVVISTLNGRVKRRCTVHCTGSWKQKIKYNKNSWIIEGFDLNKGPCWWFGWPLGGTVHRLRNKSRFESPSEATSSHVDQSKLHLGAPFTCFSVYMCKLCEQLRLQPPCTSFRLFPQEGTRGTELVIKHCMPMGNFWPQITLAALGGYRKGQIVCLYFLTTHLTFSLICHIYLHWVVFFIFYLFILQPWVFVWAVLSKRCRAHFSIMFRRSYI